MKARAHRKPAARAVRIAKVATASEAIGTIEKSSDTFILTYGQFSLIDALVAILDQTGPADVVISTWTAADADLQKSMSLLESAQIKSLRLVVDGSFETRKPDICFHMRQLFGAGCIRHVGTHAKFMVIRSATHDVAVRTSMNMNQNNRIENIEVSEDRSLAEFLWGIVDEIFEEVEAGKGSQRVPALNGTQEELPYKEVRANVIRRESVREARTTHAIRRDA